MSRVPHVSPGQIQEHSAGRGLPRRMPKASCALEEGRPQRGTRSTPGGPRDRQPADALSLPEPGNPPRLLPVSEFVPTFPGSWWQVSDAPAPSPHQGEGTLGTPPLPHPPAPKITARRHGDPAGLALALAPGPPLPALSGSPALWTPVSGRREHLCPRAPGCWPL